MNILHLKVEVGLWKCHARWWKRVQTCTFPICAKEWRDLTTEGLGEGKGKKKKLIRLLRPLLFLLIPEASGVGQGK